MTTSKKREKFVKEYPDFLKKTYEFLESQDYRSIDEMLNRVDYLPGYVRDYVITLLCDELINLTNENNNGY